MFYRFDRSMSLPLNSPQANQDDSDIMEPIVNGRKMDFALCKLKCMSLFHFVLMAQVRQTVFSMHVSKRSHFYLIFIKMSFKLTS